MSDFGRTIDLARNEEYTPPPAVSSSGGWEPPAPAVPVWTPDKPALLVSSGPLPGLFTSAGVDDSPSPLMSSQERQQRANEAALVAKGGQFTGDNSPSWSQSHMTKDPPPHQDFGDAFADFHNHVTDTQQQYEDKLHYPAGLAGMVATGAVAVEDFAHGTVCSVRGASDNLESTMEAISPVREDAHPSATLAIEQGAKTAGRIGQSILDVTAVSDPAAGAMSDLGGGLTPAELAYASDGAAEIESGGAGQVLDGSLERNTVNAESGRNGVRVKQTKDLAKRSEFPDLSVKAEKQRRDQVAGGREPSEPVPRELPHKPLSESEKDALNEKQEARTLTDGESDRLDWDRRLDNRRARGVAGFWQEERERLRQGQPGTRNWTPEQLEDILAGRTPKGADGKAFEGHHRYGVATYPANAAQPSNIYPATDQEHLNRWHDGNTQTEVHGEPLNPNYPEEQ